MEVLKVYRGVRDISPSKIIDFFIGKNESGFVVGKGMYFAFNLNYAKDYIYRKEQVGIIGYFTLSGDVKILDDQEDLDTPVHTLIKQYNELDSLFKEISIELEGEFRSLPEGAKEYWSDKEQADFLKESLSLINKKRELHPNHDSLWEEMKQLLNKMFALKDQISQERNNYDISIENYTEVCVHTPKVKIDLIRFDLYFNQEEMAKEVYDKVKSGDLSGSKILNIDASLLDLASMTVDKYIKS